MSHTISLQISTRTFLELTDYLREYGDERDPSEIAAIAIDAWLALAKGEVPYQPSARGYQWKGLFLPERTEVRMLNRGAYTYAHVVGDALVYGGQGLTPSQFAGLIGGAGRNAWRDLWIRLPGSRQWKKAGYHRNDQNRPAKDSEGVFRLETPTNTSAAMAASLKNALALVDKASSMRRGQLTRRTDVLPDD
jgi:hypothetical protein